MSHGLTDWKDGNFVPSPHDELTSLAAWARTSLDARGNVRSDLIQEIKLLARRTELRPAYEASTEIGRAHV